MNIITFWCLTHKQGIKQPKEMVAQKVFHFYNMPQAAEQTL